MSNAALKQILPRDANAAHDGRDLLRLSERTQFTQQLRHVLQSLFGLCASALELPLSETLLECEKQLIRLADKATINLQNLYFDSVHQLRHGRPHVAPRFLCCIEDSLARLDENPLSGRTRAVGAPVLKLALTDSVQLDDSLVLSDIATKVELRVREPLYSLGHRFGMLAGTARIATEVMPLGPRAMVEALRYATAHLDLPLEHRLVLYRCFERVVMNPIGTLYVALNNCLIERNVLPQLHTLAGAPKASSDSARPASPGSPRLHDSRPASLTPRGAAAGPQGGSGNMRGDGGAEDSFGKLRQLLAECRRAEACTASLDELQAALDELQTRDQAATPADAAPALRSGEEIRHQILARLRERRVDGRTPRIGEEQDDIIDLTAMLFEYLSRRARADGMANWILARLQVAILRAALADRGVFSDATDAARRLLNDLVEAAQFWVDENEAETDPALIEALQRLTRKVAAESAGDASVFVHARQELARHLETLARKVAVAERRHIEAAMGREKLERSRLLAAAAIGARVDACKPNEFLRTLLECGWSDVLAMTLLREGEDSADYRRRLDVVDQLLATPLAAGGSPLPDLRHDVESGLRQVGLHDDDVHAIAQKLFAGPHQVRHDNPISATELAIKLKRKTRLGGEHRPGPAQLAGPVGADAPALTAGEQQILDRLHALPTGTWFEFKDNPEGDMVRRKLCWYSLQTGRCLFITQRGVPSEEMTMQHLAREVAAERARIAGAEQAPLIDRAWTTICRTLDSFSGGKADSKERMSAAAEPGGADRTAQCVAPRSRKSCTLLVVDDEVNIQRALTRLLRAEGYRILCATSAAEGMEILAQHDVQVIVSDQRMPGISGTEFLSTVKTTHPNTVRILLSGYSDVAAVTDAINRGIVYKFLTKPWDDEDIRTQVREAFEASELQ